MTAPGTPGPTRRERREQEAKGGSRRRIVIILVVILLVVAAGIAGWYFLVRDDDSSSSTSSTSSSATVSSSTTSTSTTSTTSAASTTTAPLPTDPQGYAEALFAAWAANDRAAAARVADQAAVDSLFTNPSSEASAYTFSSCQAAAGSIFCSWTRPGGQLQMTVRDATGGLPVTVVDVFVGPS